MKKILLASTAIVGGALFASSAANAGNVTAGDTYAVSINGVHRVLIGQYDNDNNASTGRGYGIATPYTEVHFNAKAQADNGIKYGVTIELETRGDGTVADEFYANVDGDSWGRVELGGNDGAADRMMISGHNALVATGGYSGGLGMRQFLGGGTTNGFGSTQNNNLSRWDGPITTSSDAVKFIYFTPRFSGFQLGASLTPTVANGGRGATGENTTSVNDTENLYELGVNYTNKFGDVGVKAGLTYQHGDVQTSGAAAATVSAAGVATAAVAGAAAEDLKVLSIGASVNFAGFTLAAGYQDMNDSGLTKTLTTAGGDAGDIWNVGLGYKTGPWGVSAGYQYGERDVSRTASASVGVIALGAQYTVTPGWTAMAELGIWDVDTGVAGTKADKEVFMIVNQFVF